MFSTCVKKITAMILTLVLMLTMFTACSPSEDEAKEPAEGNVASDNPEEEKLEEYVFITHAITLEFWKTHEAAVTAAAAALPGNCVGYMVGDAGSDPSKMETILDTLLQRDTLAGMVMSGVFPEVYGAAIDKAWEMGIPSCTITANIPDCKKLTHLGTNEIDLAYEMARVLHERVGSGAKVIVTQNMFSASDTAKQRLEGIAKYDEEHDDFEVVAYVDDKGDAGTCAAAVSAAMLANPDANGILGCNAASGIGAATGVRELGKTGEMTIVCVDPDETTVEAIQNGEIYATVCGRVYTSVYMAVQIMWAWNHDQYRLVRDTMSTDDYLPIPKYIDTGVYVIHQGNVDSFV